MSGFASDWFYWAEIMIWRKSADNTFRTVRRVLQACQNFDLLYFNHFD